ncbi:11251_t:CDS:1, partial [Gigaspora margarita]
GNHINIQICKEDKVEVLKDAVKNLGHQDSNFYVIIPKNSTAEMFDYFKNGTFYPNQ